MLRAHGRRERQLVRQTDGCQERQVDLGEITRGIDSGDIGGALRRIREHNIAGGDGQGRARRPRQAEQRTGGVACERNRSLVHVAVGERDTENIVVQRLVGVIAGYIEAAIDLADDRIAHRRRHRVGGTGGVEIAVDPAKRISGAIGADFRAQAVITDRCGIGHAPVRQMAVLGHEAEGRQPVAKAQRRIDIEATAQTHAAGIRRAVIVAEQITVEPPRLRHAEHEIRGFELPSGPDGDARRSRARQVRHQQHGALQRILVDDGRTRERVID